MESSCESWELGEEVCWMERVQCEGVRRRGGERVRG